MRHYASRRLGDGDCCGFIGGKELVRFGDSVTSNAGFCSLVTRKFVQDWFLRRPRSRRTEIQIRRNVARLLGRGNEVTFEKGGLPHAPLGEKRAGADEPQVEFSQVLFGEERSGKVPDVLWAIHEISLNIRTWYNYTE
jgi:hypothetical protein